MKTRLFFAVLLMAGCGFSNNDPLTVSRNLAKDFDFAIQNPPRPKDHVFHPATVKIGGKRYPSLLQNASGEINFHLLLGKKPRLRCLLNWDVTKSTGTLARIRIESDFPEEKKTEYSSALPKNWNLDLSDFQNRVVRITFRIDGALSQSGPAYWIQPIVEEVQEPPVAERNELLASLRDRHIRDNVMIFLLDAGRPSHFGCYGYSKGTTPQIDSVASEGIVFTRAITQAVYTVASTASLLTGLYPDVHGVIREADALHPDFKTMAECFREAGYETALFTANPNASPLRGEDQGFHRIWEGFKHVPGGVVSAHHFVPVIQQWLDETRDQPFFAYVHLREPHEPYNPPAKYLESFRTKAYLLEDLRKPNTTEAEKSRVQAAYDANLAYGDEQIGKILSDLKSRNFYDRTVILILSDHGEALWDHDIWGHGWSVYEETLRIPLIFRLPRESQLRGLRSAHLVGTIDVMPTLLDLLGISKKGVHTQGKSFLPILFGSDKEDQRLLLSQTGGQKIYAISSKDKKYIQARLKHTQEDQFFSLSTDPYEKENLIHRYSILSSFYQTEMRKQLEAMREVGSATKGKKPRKAQMDEETKEKLRALGYVY